MRHPILARRTTLAAYLLAWVPFGGLMAVLGRSQGWTWAEALALAVAQTFTGAFLVLSAWYLCRALPIERSLSSGRWIAWSMDALLVGLAWAGLATLEAKALALAPTFATLPLKVGRAFPVLWALGALFQAAGIALHYLLLALERSREVEKAGQALKALAQEAELKALRAQINPHFLFNSLNSISALTSLDPAKARTMCVLLSDFLRITLGLGERTSVSLTEELALLRTYLEIEQVRFGKRLQVSWDIEEAVAAINLPPLLLQPLVENAIKHGIAQVAEGGLLGIRAWAEEGRACIQVENPRDPDEPVPPGLGLGLRAVRERLKGRFGERARLELESGPTFHRVRLNIPLLESKESA